MSEHREPEGRYATRGIMAEIPEDIQGRLWDLFRQRYHKEPQEVDYLHVFDLSVVKNDDATGNQQIIHRQEQPPFRASYTVKVYQPCQRTVWIIDDGDYATMLLPEEY